MSSILVLGCGRNFLPRSSQSTNGENGVQFEPPLAPKSFLIARADVRLIPYKSIESKIKYLIADLPASVLQPMRAINFQMSDYDYSQGISPESSWGRTKMSDWMTALMPICQSVQLHQQYTFPAQAIGFIERAYGRNKLATDDQLITEVTAIATNNDEKIELLCVIVLSSAEFVGQ
ncbi:MAG: hypothetical protein IPJ71_05950 [Bdellovibrionales bacterium]|nr:hypothetical protein [Bdellovibrionales bacterium]